MLNEWLVTRVLSAVIWFLDLVNKHVCVYRTPYMHGVDIYYIEDLLLTLGSDKFSHGNKKPDLAILVITYFSTKLLLVLCALRFRLYSTRLQSSVVSYTLYAINSQLSQGVGCMSMTDWTNWNSVNNIFSGKHVNKLWYKAKYLIYNTYIYIYIFFFGHKNFKWKQ